MHNPKSKPKALVYALMNKTQDYSSDSGKEPILGYSQLLYEFDLIFEVNLSYLEEGMRRYSELQTQEFLMNAALSSHQLTG